MIFVYALCVVHAAIYPRCEVLRKADQGLAKEEDIRDHAEYSMWRLEVCSVMVELIVFDYNKTGYECGNA